MESTQCLPSSSSSSSSTSQRWDVFLSFRGADTRVGFIGHLYDDLVRHGIITFKDDKKLEMGDSFPLKLLEAIEESKCAIIVFSTNYAASTWCLEELVKIVECKKDMGLLVLPVFYDVNPSVVRHQTDTFGKAIAKHKKRFKKNMKKVRRENMKKVSRKNREKVRRWRKALKEVADIGGEDLSKRDRDEIDAIKKLTQKILKVIPDKCPNVTKDLVGIDSQVEKLNLDFSSNDAHVIGIWGMGGIGKTTLANAVFDMFSNQFEGCSFISNVKDALKERDLIQLQQQLLSDMKLECEHIHSARAGVNRIKFSLRSKKILLVLDDVDDKNQLKKLVQLDCFDSGSRIIITTRDKHLLKTLKVCHIYKCEQLNNFDALKLFCLKAFDKDQPKQGYEKLSEDIVDYASGLPLALDCLGTLLFGRKKNIWESALERLKKRPDGSIFKNLKRSYDALRDDTEKKIFIYIACFLNGRKKNLVTNILDGLGVYPNIGMSVLTRSSLITISKNEVQVHSLLQQMGWEILRNEPLDKYTGLKFREEIVYALTNNMGTNTIEIINQESSTIKVEECTCKSNAFFGMRELRFLNIRDVHFPDGIEYLSDKLQILEWYGYPSEHLPLNFEPKEIWELQMRSSNIEKLWEGNKEFNNLGFIDLHGSTNLIQTPNLSRTPKLKHLNLSGCTNLVEVHGSIFVHKSLNRLNLAGCTSLQLKRFQNEIKMNSLKILDLSGCSSIKRIPKFGEDMKSLHKLCLDWTAIKKLPSSIKHLTCLASLYARNCKNLVHIRCNLCDLRSLRVVKFSKDLKLEKLPENLEKIVCWENLEPVTSAQTASVETSTSNELTNGDGTTSDSSEERRSKRRRGEGPEPMWI